MELNNMPKGVYTKTEEHKKKISETLKGNIPWNNGKYRSEKTKRKISETLKRNPHRAMFKKGHINSKEVREKISKALKGRIKEEHPCWKGGKWKNSTGYIRIYKPNHPNAICSYVLEHRYMMEKHLDRYLKPTESVHHINFIKDDNRIENLKLFKNNLEHLNYHKFLRDCVREAIAL
jgi:hypothetical protein